MTISVEYRLIEGFPGYRVGNDGTVWTCKNARWGFRKTWRKMRPSISGRGKGHYSVTLCRDGKYYRRYVHALVLTAFVGPRPLGMEGCHKDDVRSNNHLSNLKWDTSGGNRQDAIRNGGIPLGDRHWATKYSDATVAKIRSMGQRGISRSAIAEQLSVPYFYVCNTLNERSRRSRRRPSIQRDLQALLEDE